MSQSTLDYRLPRKCMLQKQLEATGIVDCAVLDSMARVPRHAFVPEAFVSAAYEDRSLPIGHGQTISQPKVVAWMCQLLEAKRGMSVLEIGTGSGYQAAVLQAMGLVVFSVERLAPLYWEVKDLFERLGLRNIRTFLSDGTLGWPDMAPFDRIIVTAGGPGIPETLTDQLTDPGILVMPVGKRRGSQQLVRIIKDKGNLRIEKHGAVAFVDLVGDYGWAK